MNEENLSHFDMEHKRKLSCSSTSTTASVRQEGILELRSADAESSLRQASSSPVDIKNRLSSFTLGDTVKGMTDAFATSSSCLPPPQATSPWLSSATYPSSPPRTSHHVRKKRFIGRPSPIYVPPNDYLQCKAASDYSPMSCSSIQNSCMSSPVSLKGMQLGLASSDDDSDSSNDYQEERDAERVRYLSNGTDKSLRGKSKQFGKLLAVIAQEKRPAEAEVAHEYIQNELMKQIDNFSANSQLNDNHVDDRMEVHTGFDLEVCNLRRRLSPSKLTSDDFFIVRSALSSTASSPVNPTFPTTVPPILSYTPPSPETIESLPNSPQLPATSFRRTTYPAPQQSVFSMIGKRKASMSVTAEVPKRQITEIRSSQMNTSAKLLAGISLSSVRAVGNIEGIETTDANSELALRQVMAVQGLNLQRASENIEKLNLG